LRRRLRQQRAELVASVSRQHVPRAKVGLDHPHEAAMANPRAPSAPVRSSVSETSRAWFRPKWISEEDIVTM